MPLSRTLDQHNRQIESVVETFSRHLDRLISRAHRAVAAKLFVQLEMEDGRVARSPANRRVLGEISKLLLAEMAGEGLQGLLNALAESFNGQFRYLADVLRQTIGEKAAEKLAEARLNQEDKTYLAIQQADAVQGIKDLVTNAANMARKNVLFGIGGLSPKDLSERVAETFDRTPGQAKTDAATAMSTFFRSAADMSYRKIEDDPNFEVRYKYVGPPASDPVIRPFCEHLMDDVSDGKTWTRDEINDMDNEQLDDVFTTGGGYNCRHQWVVADIIETREN